MTDLNRRNFLKGLMAAAGVAAVGIPLAPAVAEIVPEPPRLPFPDADVGDIFMQVANAWRFVGRASQLSIKVDRHEEEVWISARERKFRALSTVDITAAGEVIFDPEGEQLLYRQFIQREWTDFAVGQGRHGIFVLKRSAIVSMQRLFEQGEGHHFVRTADGRRLPRLGLGAIRNEFELNISEIEISHGG